MQAVFDFLRTDDIPPIARRTFTLERSHYMLWSLVLGTVEGNLAGIVAARTFGASELLTTIVWAAPIIMMTLNVFWGVIMRGRRRVRVLVTLTCSASVLILSIGFTSPEWKPWGGWMFALQIAATHLFTTGLVTLRSSMWKVNYRPADRGRIVGRLQTIRFLFVPISAAIVATQFSLDPQHYRIVYPAAAGLGLLSLVPLRRFRIRGEKLEIQRFHDKRDNSALATQSPAVRFWSGVKEAGLILRHDGAFRRYMTAQFTLGSANFFTDPVLLVVLTVRLGYDYLPSTMLMTVIPGVCSWIAIRFWAPYFDRVGVLRFRVVNCGVWTVAYMCIAASMLIIGSGRREIAVIAIAILVIARILKGIAHGGGLIAWSIGHLHFAKPDQVDLYMSIHVALTGLRALLLPQLGRLANAWLGDGSFATAILISAAAMLLFYRLAQAEPPREEATS